jgi:hypothetical protein
VSHTWSACWGTLVVAALDGAAHGRVVWADNGAVRQFPGNAADLDFGGVIGRCQAVLLVAQALPGVAGLQFEARIEDQNFGKLISGQAIPADERPLVAACRAWCLAEVNAAMKHGKPLVVKAGSAARRALAGGGGAVAVHFVPDAAMLRNMSHLIDVEHADASVPADKEMILSWVRAEPGGTAAMNLRIAAALQAAHALAQLPPAVAAAIDAFSCGERAQLGLLDAGAKAEALRGSAAAGLVAAVRLGINSIVTFVK